MLITKMQLKRIKPEHYILSAVCGVIVTLLSGLFENSSKGIILGAKSYGYPWIWRSKVVQMTNQNIVRLDNIVADIAFWLIIFFIALIVVERFVFSRSDSLLNSKHFVLSAGLLIPMGVLMGFLHELGHVFAGTALGGTLTFLKVGYFEFYPKLALVSKFELGATIITGLSTQSQYGIFLLAGSLTTSMAALFIGLILYTKKMGYLTMLPLTILGVLGLLGYAILYWFFFSWS